MRWLTIPITASGAIVHVEFGVISPRRKALIEAGLPVPQPVTVPMLVDTGASHTFIDSSVLIGRLGLTAKNRHKFHSASTSQDAPQECEGFDVSLTLGSASEQTLWRIEVLEVMASNERRDHGLLGRDILKLVQLEWRGTSEVLRIGYV